MVVNLNSKFNTMKNKLKMLGLLALVATGSLLTFNACDKVIAINVSKDYANIDLLITAPQSAGTISFNKDVTSDLEALASSKGFSIDKIESATINSVTIKINDTDPNPITTSIIQSAKVYLTADNVASTEVAGDDNSHTSATQMDLDMKGIDAAPYIKSSKFNVKAELVTNQAINHDVPINISMSCTFKVKPLSK
jgi:hypothetical protein